ncbi:hypothetical protein C3L33_02098, partial [Rhododendron williamsianum]
MFPGTITTTAAADGTTVTTNGDSLTRRFVSFPVGKNILANPSEHDFPLLPVPHQSLCRGSHKGWLVMVDKDMSMYLQNPFTGRRIDLPPVTSLPRADSSWASMSKWYIEKVIMSASPSSSSSSSSSDCFVVVFFGPGDQVGFCKVGDKNWRLLKNPESSGYYIDGIYYKEQFHIVDEYGKIYVSDPLDSPDQPKLNEFYPQNRHSIDYVQKWYLVECGVFLGYNQSFALSKSDLMSYKGDRIYYTDDDIASHQLRVRSGQDMGIFSLRDSKFEPLCSTNSESTKPPAVWITPCDGGSN